jgi:hypothetical protein
MTCASAGLVGRSRSLLSSGSRVRILPGAPIKTPGQRPYRWNAEQPSRGTPPAACHFRARCATVADLLLGFAQLRPGQLADRIGEPVEAPYRDFGLIDAV